MATPTTAAEQELDKLLNPAEAGSIDSTIKVYADETALDPKKTQGRHHRALLGNIINRTKQWVKVLYEKQNYSGPYRAGTVSVGDIHWTRTTTEITLWRALADFTASAAPAEGTQWTAFAVLPVTVSSSDLAALEARILALETAMKSDDPNLDTIQEIVNYIKANRSAISSLSSAHDNLVATVNAIGSRLTSAENAILTLQQWITSTDPRFDSFQKLVNYVLALTTDSTEGKSVPTWIVPPLITMDASYNILVKNIAPDLPTADWNGFNVVADTGGADQIIFSAVTPPATGVLRADAVDLAPQGGWEYNKGLESTTAAVPPAQVNNRLRGAYIIWNGSTGTVQYPESNAPVDVVQDGNMNPVTSNAVFDELLKYLPLNFNKEYILQGNAFDFGQAFAKTLADGSSVTKLKRTYDGTDWNEYRQTFTNGDTIKLLDAVSGPYAFPIREYTISIGGVGYTSTLYQRWENGVFAIGWTIGTFGFEQRSDGKLYLNGVEFGSTLSGEYLLLKGGNMAGLLQTGGFTAKATADNQVLVGVDAKVPVIDAGSHIHTLGAITGGSLYTDGTYAGKALTGGTGTGATADIVVSGGAVTSVTMVNRGTGFTAGDVLSATLPAGSGFSVPASKVGFQGVTAKAISGVDAGSGSTEVVQTTGTSTTAVMSQDATTKELAKKQNLDEELEVLMPDANNVVTLSMDNNRDCRIHNNAKPANIKFGGTANFNKCRFITVVADGTAAPVIDNMFHEVNAESVFRVATGTINRLRMRTDANNLGNIIVYYVWV